MLNPETFSAVFDAHGLYSTEQFVLRLSPKNHALLDKITLGKLNQADVSDDLIQAYSTYIHETIHWWQHIGSTSGFVLSMCYPLQLHNNFEYIRMWSSLGSPVKPIKKAATQGEIDGLTHTDPRQAAANMIVNNTMDLQTFRRWILEPEKAEEIYNDNHFLSQGHCFRIVYISLLDQVCNLIDPSYSIFPDPDCWADQFDKLAADQVLGYYYGSPMFRRPIGVRELFEGQACFSQMQFLAGTGTADKDLEGFRKAGMLHGVYERAFKEFLNQTKITPPTSVLDPIVGLFLLICDLAINPMEGFPCDITDHSEFVNNADPGIRFLMLCRAVKANKDDLIDYIKDYSREEYLTLSSIISEAAGFLPPCAGWKTIKDLMISGGPIKSLMEEHKILRFSPNNIVLRVLLSHFMSFTLDKSMHPHFFCWAGIWKANAQSDAAIIPLWLRNLSLFSDKEDDDGIFIRKRPGAADEDLQNTLNNFFSSIIICDLSRQWVLNEGAFSYNFKWLSQHKDSNHWRNLADEAFARMYGVKTSDIVFT